MRKLLVGLSASALLLTGCSSGQSIENETKLVEYKACIDSLSNLAISSQERYPGVGVYDFSKILSACDKYKPEPVKK